MIWTQGRFDDKRRNGWPLIVAITLTIMLLLPAATAKADTMSSGSGTQYASFLWCSQGTCVVLTYPWSGLITVDYGYNGTNYTLNSENQSVDMRNNAAYSNCSIQVAITTDVYQNGSYYGTVYVGQRGAYVYPVGDIVWGGITYMYWSLYGPSMQGFGTASANNCSWSPGLTWSFSIP